ncbi:hypothetical protein EYR41_008660 [Orbilia oligospora]|uniref:Uncharacterized protein n=1 Tax=Orbilia oligospora TaxID=2813651 RepID=A0A7C8PSA2_ORBOL|nr:hypothetical protein TWF751_002395 [Orbilia oligospora]KAF3291733.1 hypothetical protein TWF132_006481 [Orbilia oligospora]TGJ67079.1 hypothetical protein EYR41_008660 [Orbilia oligospora]
MCMKLSALFLTLLVGYAIPGGLTAAVGNHGPESSVNSETHPPVESPTNSPLDPHATKHSTTGQGTEFKPPVLSPNETSLVKIPVQKNSTTEEKRAISSTIFFSWSVVCPSHFRMIATELGPYSYPEINHHKRPSFRNMASQRAHARAYSARTVCMNCLCDSTGKMIASPRERNPGIARTLRCITHVATMKCQMWYNCRCEATMHQPEADPGITVEEYQDALDNIPLDIKIANSKYAWKFSEDQSLSWNYIFDPDKSGSGQAEQYLVPGTKEPYYLEGADTGAARSGIPPPLLELGSKLRDISTVELEIVN